MVATGARLEATFLDRLTCARVPTTAKPTSEPNRAPEQVKIHMFCAQSHTPIHIVRLLCQERACRCIFVP